MTTQKAREGAAGTMTDDDAEFIRSLARFHHQHYLGDDKLPALAQLVSFAAKQGIETIGIDLPCCMEFRAIAVELANGHQYIVYNTAQPIEIQTHYVGHEVFHLVAEHPAGWCPERETAADLYAATLLRLVWLDLAQAEKGSRESRVKYA